MMDNLLGIVTVRGPCRCINGCKKDTGFTCMQSAGLRSIDYEQRKQFLQLSLDFGMPGLGSRV